MDNPTVKKDLVDSILELRAEAEQQLTRNKYYIAVQKLDELLELIRPLEAGVTGEERSEPTASTQPTDNPNMGGVGRDELGDEPDAQMLADDEEEYDSPRYSEDAA